MAWQQHLLDNIFGGKPDDIAKINRLKCPMRNVISDYIIRYIFGENSFDLFLFNGVFDCCKSSETFSLPSQGQLGRKNARAFKPTFALKSQSFKIEEYSQQRLNYKSSVGSLNFFGFDCYRIYRGYFCVFLYNIN